MIIFLFFLSLVPKKKYENSITAFLKRKKSSLYDNDYDVHLKKREKEEIEANILDKA